ncbi:uncharacterized protein YihR [Arthrobacter sp. Hiyo1]|nr:uncharacterized protein YihR [Arthrobacter sp. Hiyo1]
MPPTTPSSTPGEETVSRRFASGRQFEIRRGDALAVVTELAAGLRLFSRDGVQLTESYGDAQLPPGATGITLAPWANRIEDGIWYLDGKKQQLDITEVSRNNASHGLLRNSSYALVAEDEFSVTLEAVIFPQHGYPFLARHQVHYEIDAGLALRVSQSFINDSAAPAPFVLGAHPYLRVGDVPPEEMVLTVHAGTRLVADERLIPRSSVPVDGDFDFGAAGVWVAWMSMWRSRIWGSTAASPAKRCRRRMAEASPWSRTKAAPTSTSSSRILFRAARKRWRLSP